MGRPVTAVRMCSAVIEVAQLKPEHDHQHFRAKLAFRAVMAAVMGLVTCLTAQNRVQVYPGDVQPWHEFNIPSLALIQCYFGKMYAYFRIFWSKWYCDYDEEVAFGGCEALGSTIERFGGVDRLLGRVVMGRASHNHQFLLAEQTCFCEVLEI